MLKKFILGQLILGIALIGIAHADVLKPTITATVVTQTQNPYPDTSEYKEMKLNVAQLNDKSKYVITKALKVNFSRMFITYHEGIDKTTPKYVSLLWEGKVTAGIVYYENGVFHIWMKKHKFDPTFKKIDITIKQTQKNFKLDFEAVWDYNFVLSISS